MVPVKSYDFSWPLVENSCMIEQEPFLQWMNSLLPQRGHLWETLWPQRGTSLHLSRRQKCRQFVVLLCPDVSKWNQQNMFWTVEVQIKVHVVHSKCGKMTNFTSVATHLSSAFHCCKREKAKIFAWQLGTNWLMLDIMYLPVLDDYSPRPHWNSAYEAVYGALGPPYLAWQPRLRRNLGDWSKVRRSLMAPQVTGAMKSPRTNTFHFVRVEAHTRIVSK